MIIINRYLKKAFTYLLVATLVIFNVLPSAHLGAFAEGEVERLKSPLPTVIEDVYGVYYVGNDNGENMDPNLEEILQGLKSLKVETIESDEYSNGNLEVDLTFSKLDSDELNILDWTSNIGITHVFVKAGNGGYLYSYDGKSYPVYEDERLMTPDYKKFSHITFYYECEPDIEIVKSADKLTATVGDTITYTYEVTNTGNVPLSNITVNDDVLGNITLDTTTLEKNGDTAEGTATYTVVVGDFPGPLENEATAKGYHNSQEVQDSDTWSVTLTNPPVQTEYGTIVLSKIVESDEVPRALTTEDTTKFSIRVHGGLFDETYELADGEEVTIEDLPLDVTYSISEDEESMPEGYKLKTIEIDEEETNEVQLTEENDEATVVVINEVDEEEEDEAAIQLIKTADRDTATVGDQITYTYTVTNIGELSLSQITVVDNELGNITLDSTSLTSGASITGTASYTVAAEDLPGPLENEAIVKGYYIDEEYVQDTDNESVNLAAIQLIKTADKSTATIGEEITYTYTVTNMGNVQLDDVTVVDDMLGTISLDTTTLEKNGDMATGTKSYTVKSEDLEKEALINIATVMGYYNDEEYVDDDGTVTVTLTDPTVEPEYGTIVLRKVVEFEALRALATEDAVKFSIRVYGGEFDETYELADGEEVTIEDLPLDVTYTISEDEESMPDGFKFKAIYIEEGETDEVELTEENDAVTAVVVNEIEEEEPPVYGTITLTKEIYGEEDDSYSEETSLIFNITVSGGNFNQTYELKPYESKVIENLPLGVIYTISEDEESMPNDYEFRTIYIDEEEESQVELTENNREVYVTVVNEIEEDDPPPPPSDPDPGKIRIVKTIGSADGEPQEGVAFTITRGSYSKIKETNSNGVVTFTGLKSGTYTIEEVVPEGYVTDLLEGYTVRVRADKTTTVYVINTKLEEPEKPEEPEEPETPEECDTDGSDTDSGSDTDTEDVVCDTTDTGTPTAPDTDEVPDLPNTGGPVEPEMAMAGLGAISLLTGMILSRRKH